MNSSRNHASSLRLPSIRAWLRVAGSAISEAAQAMDQAHSEYGKRLDRIHARIEPRIEENRLALSTPYTIPMPQAIPPGNLLILGRTSHRAAFQRLALHSPPSLHATNAAAIQTLATPNGSLFPTFFGGGTGSDRLAG